MAPPQQTLDKAYALLARRPHSRSELAGKLKQRQLGGIKETLEHLTEQGYLDDVSFARRWVEQRGDARGNRLLSLELRRKGVSADAIEQALAERSEPGERAAARQLAERRLKHFSGKSWDEIQPKLAAFLARRGYSYATVRAALADLQPSE